MADHEKVPAAVARLLTEDDRRRPPSAATHALVRSVLVRSVPREVPEPPETWPIIEHEPEHIPDVPPDLSERRRKEAS